MRTGKELENEGTGDLPLDREQPGELKTATFSMGCFWGPEAFFGAQDGVVRTWAGYTGGEKRSPEYRSLGDHTETVQIDYDPDKISYEELLELFWNNHDPSRKRKTQYASRIFYHTELQKKLAEETKERYEDEHGEIYTKILPAETFWVAEDYHQKYRLRQRKDLMENFSNYSPEEFINSTAAARMNGFVMGHLPEKPGEIENLL